MGAEAGSDDSEEEEQEVDEFYEQIVSGWSYEVNFVVTDVCI